GGTSNPRAPFRRVTMAPTRSSRPRANPINPWYAESAHTCTNRSLAALASVTASRAPLLSATSAVVTASPHTSPSVSTHTCRLTPVVFFSPVEPPRARLLGPLDRLAVGDARRRLVVVPPLGRPHLPPPGVLHPVPGAVLLPLREVPEGGVPVRQVRRQGPPGAPLADGVQDGIEDSPAGVLRRPAAGLVGRDQGLEDGPQLVAHPGRVRGGGRHPCRFHAPETTLDRSTDSRLFFPQALSWRQSSTSDRMSDQWHSRCPRRLDSPLRGSPSS